MLHSVERIDMDSLQELVLSSGKRDLVIDPPLMNASGMLGFADEARKHLDFHRMGAFVTNTVSLSARTPANPPRVLPYPGGFLLHTGHPNPGLSRTISRYQQTWRDMPIPVIVNLLALSVEEAAGMVQSLEGLENVMAVELLVRAEPMHEAQALIAAASSGELPVIARAPLTATVELIQCLQEAGAHAVSLGPPRGSLPGPNGEHISGRLYGAAFLALGIEALQRIHPHVSLPLLVGCGITTQEELRRVVAAGAAGVQMDYQLWRYPKWTLIIDKHSRQ
jgi:dihydroorotate dehydrogenase (NAD+) catalytic subunit